MKFISGIARDIDRILQTTPISISERQTRLRPYWQTRMMLKYDEYMQPFLRSKDTKLYLLKMGEKRWGMYQKKYDAIYLVLIDMIMPLKSDNEICGDIKKLNAEMKVIFTSGYGADPIDKESLVRGRSGLHQNNHEGSLIGSRSQP